jgi:hypothetical protein
MTASEWLLSVKDLARRLNRESRNDIPREAGPAQQAPASNK